MLPEVVYLQGTLDFPLTVGEMMRVLSEMGYQVNGDVIDVIDFLEKLAIDIETKWPTEFADYYLSQLTETQYLYTNRNVKVYPHESDINLVWEENYSANPDAPWDKLGGIILADIEREAPASLSRRPFGSRRELKPRIRFYVNYNQMYYPLFAQRKEYIIRFDCFANTGKEAHIMRSALEKYFNIYQEKLYELGAQKFYVEASRVSGRGTGVGSEPTKTDRRSMLRQRTLYLYLRLEEWYLGAAIPEITSIEMQWNVLPQGTVDSGNASMDSDSNGTIIIETPIN